MTKNQAPHECGVMCSNRKGMTVKLDMSEVNKDYLHQKSHRNLFPTDSVFNGGFQILYF